MSIKNLVLSNHYRDSVMLMRLSQDLEALAGIVQATAMMGTENNKTLMDEAALLTDDGRAARPNDLVIALRLSSRDLETSVVPRVRELLEAGAAPESSQSNFTPRSLDGAVEATPDANLALISVPGPYAAYEATNALDRDLNVLLFSNNVSIEDEVALKRRAVERGLFMFGPDCGTAIINGVPLGFANHVPRGRVGLVSASGTGLQQVICLLAASGEGVSQALGVGGRDLDDRVGGVMMLEGIRALESDGDTEVMVLISKPPGELTRGRILDEVSNLGMPCVVCFLGVEDQPKGSPGVFMEPTLERAATKTLALLGLDSSDIESRIVPSVTEQMSKAAKAINRESRYIRGLYSGGTLCHEALLLLRHMDDADIYSNLDLAGVRSLDGAALSGGHHLIDLGDDVFTVGRPHPIIDLRERCQHIVREAANLEVGVLLLDVMLGYGAHPDPASELAPALKEARRIASRDERSIAAVVVLCGTRGDPQSFDRQREELTGAGAIVVQSNAQAVTIAAAISRGDLRLAGNGG